MHFAGWELLWRLLIYTNSEVWVNFTWMLMLDHPAGLLPVRYLSVVEYGIFLLPHTFCDILNRSDPGGRITLFVNVDHLNYLWIRSLFGSDKSSDSRAHGLGDGDILQWVSIIDGWTTHHQRNHAQGNRGAHVPWRCCGVWFVYSSLLLPRFALHIPHLCWVISLKRWL